jgi:hypothetical protein
MRANHCRGRSPLSGLLRFARNDGKAPGALLVDKLTDQLLAADVEAIESCSPEGGFMARLWASRRTTSDLLVDVGARRSIAFAAAAMGEWGYAQLRALRNALRAGSWRTDQKRRGLAPST